MCLQNVLFRNRLFEFWNSSSVTYNGTFILPDYCTLMISIVKWGKKWLTYFFELAKTTLDTNFHASNSKNKDLQYNGTFILPDYIILIFQIVKLDKKWLAYFYRLAKTTLDTKFHISNSKNKDLQYNGTFILPNLGFKIIYFHLSIYSCTDIWKFWNVLV